MATYSVFNVEQNDRFKVFAKYINITLRSGTGYTGIINQQLLHEMTADPVSINYVEDDDNVVFDCSSVNYTISTGGTSLYYNHYREKIGAKLVKDRTKNACFVMMKANAFGQAVGYDEETDGVDVFEFPLLIGWDYDAVQIQSRYSGRPAYPPSQWSQWYVTPNSYSLRSNSTTTVWNVRGGNSNNTQNAMTGFTGTVSHYVSSTGASVNYGWNGASVSLLDSIQAQCIAKGCTRFGISCDRRYNMTASLTSQAMTSNFIVSGGWQGVMFSQCVKLPDDIPIFELNNSDDVNKIVHYLTTGDDSGSIDPFDPNNPSTATITDFNTNFDAYVTLGDPAQPYAGFTNIHWSVRALNTQYNEARDILSGMYSLDTLSTGYPWTYYKRTQAQVPVASFTDVIANNPENYNTFQFFFTEYGTPDGTQNQHSGIFMIDYAYKEGSRSKCKIRQVKFKTGDPFTSAWQHEGVELTRVNIGTDAYKYTASTGESLTIYFRGITIDDLNKTDDGYKENPDTEASPTESDVSVVSGSGLNTFSITKAQFNLINKALWSTDWTQVFKSSTIDPIKCVIACKGIKFANAGSGNVPIIIANRDTDVSSGVVNPVQSYTIDNCYIPAVRGDFTDITLMRVRCYLPYIGWVDLPSAEVVGRLAYNGVQAVSKRLTFKYIVDFIDGACRCIVSVNGTERWMFDGNCAVDIPVTSDNHTNAIGIAIKSGLATTLSIATGVAGAISGNAGAVAGGVVGAVNSAPNILPTYEYSASASPSGYVNGSCNSHIMIVCEIPNVQIPNGFARKVGRPCERNLSLGSLVGFTQCKNANVSGINATTEELTMIAQALNSGVYL